MIIYDPHFDFKVIDESIIEEEYEVPSLDTSLGTLFAGFTSRGRHNKIIECRTKNMLKSTFGDDFANFKKYGQVNQEAMRVAASKGRVFYCSLIPNDAKVAYSVFGVGVRKTNNIPVYKRTDTLLSEDGTSIVNYGSGEFVLDADGNQIQVVLKESAGDSEATKLATVSGVALTNMTVDLSKYSFDNSTGEPTGYNPEKRIITDEEGNETHFFPLFLVYYYSRGLGGNNFCYHLSRATQRDRRATDGRRYSINFYEVLSTGSYKNLYDGEEFEFSFNPDAVYSDTINDSEAIDKIYLNVIGSGENRRPLQLLPYAKMYNDLLDYIVDCGASEEGNKFDIDVLNCIYKNGMPYNKIIPDTASIDVENTIISLDHGTDGSLQLGNTLDDGTVVDEELIAKTKETLLINFFNCDVDDDIFDEKRTDIDILPDANYPHNVKRAILSSFSMYRPDIHLAMDVGITYTPEETMLMAREVSSYVNSDWSFMVSIYGQSGYMNDPQIDSTPNVVTGTYDWIGGMADNFKTPSGAFQMRAGVGRGTVRYFYPFWIAKKNKKNTIERLENLSINNIQYLNKRGDLVYMLEDTQYEIESSKLLSVRNSLVIGRIIRICAGVLVYFKFREENITQTMSNAKEALEKAVVDARIPSTITVTFDLYQTKNDVRDENCTVEIVVKFPAYIKKFHVVIKARRDELTGYRAGNAA